MTSTSGQSSQFRFTQTPSKVLHLRNMPWECTEEEVLPLCRPFGKVVNTMLNVGANRNQGFVEFAELNQAIQMVTYFASSPELAQIRGKTVYIQYSNRQEITNNKSTADGAGNVLLVTIEGVQAGDVSIDVIHLVFSAFGFVHKIATFEKTAGFQALIQYTDAATATEAKNSLDGRSIPSYLLPEHVATCYLRITYSGHKDLNIKFQSHRSRDYTNPYLPVNPTAIDGTLQPTMGPDGTIKEPESNVLLASIENVQYAVTVDVLHTVFSAFGTVQKIAIFDKSGGLHALIQYPDWATAAMAKEALEGHCIYAGGYCKLHLTYSRHTDLTVKHGPDTAPLLRSVCRLSATVFSLKKFMQNDERSRDYTIPSVMPKPLTPGASWQPTQAPAAAFPATGIVATPTGQVPLTAWNPAVSVGSYAPAQSTYTNPFPPPPAGASVPATQKMPPIPYGTSSGAGQIPNYS